MPAKTPLYEQHRKLNAKLVDFHGWEMPLHYGSQLVEHQQVRQAAGMFDVSHMNPVDISGGDARAYLRHLLANDVAKISPNRALYSCMLNENGGIIDDLIVYQLDDDYYRLVLNAGTREKDMAWLQQQSQGFLVTIQQRSDLAIVAVQGPEARSKTLAALPKSLIETSANLKPFHLAATKDWLVARTGYTGEDGFEIILPVAAVVDFWQSLLQQGVKPCGLGARDTLRLEAGLNLYGLDMDETTTPLESNLTWTVAFEPLERNFIGRTALEKQQQTGVKRQLIGLLLAQGGVLRSHQMVQLANGSSGEITSGGFSPTLNCSVAFARVAEPISPDGNVKIREKELPVRIVKTPFVRNGKPTYKTI